MPSSIELNIGHVPSPRRTRDAADDAEAGPWRIVVVGDFSGRAAGRPPLDQRRGLRVDIDTLDAVFARMAPAVRIDGLQDKSGVALQVPLASLDDLSADALLARLPAQPVPAPPAAASPATAGADAEDAEATLRRLLGGTVPAAAPARANPATVSSKTSEIVDGFIRQVLGSTPSPAPAPAAPAIGDEARSVLLRHVLRDPAWRHVENAWRSVDRFVRQLDMADGRVRLELLDCRADELLADLVAAGAEPARSALAPALRGDGRGCALIVSLEEFGASVPELSLLGGLASLAAANGATLLAGAAPALAALATNDAPEILATSEARIWHALRESELAARIGLTFPRLLARLPYGPRHDPVAAFPFEELADLPPAALHEGLAWRSAALDVACLVARAETADDDGDAPVVLEDLPPFVDRSGDESHLWPVAEAYLGEAEAQALRTAGLLVLLSDRRTPSARVPSWNSIARSGAALRG
jgi:type VI secretion system protein ImpC